MSSHSLPTHWPTTESDSRPKNLQNDINRKMWFCDTSTLCDDLRLVTEMPNLCDVMFLVGKDAVPVYGVKAIMATRSSFLYQIILARQKTLRGTTEQTKSKFALLSKLKQIRKKKYSPSEKRQSSPGLLTVHLPDENPATFRDVFQFVHSGRISVDVHNIVDVMVTADSYGLTELCSSCFHFATSFINLDSILPLLTSTLRFPQNKWIKHLLIKIWDFVEENAALIFQTSAFVKISKEAAVLILSRPKLSAKAAEICTAMSHWCRRHGDVTDKETFDSLVRELLAVLTYSQNRPQELTEDLGSVSEKVATNVDGSQLEMRAYDTDFLFVSSMSLNSVNCYKSGQLQSADLSGCSEDLFSDSGVNNGSF